MSSEGKVRVHVRSRQVPVATVVRTEPVYSPSGVFIGTKPGRMVLYGRSLDDDNRRTIEEAEKLACNLGLGLEVVDESRSGLLWRFLHRIGSNAQGYPSIVVPTTLATASSHSHTFSQGS